jgi:putative hemolysin
VYSRGYVVLIFPAGLVSRKQEEGIKDLLWKKSFVAKAKQYQLPVIPTHISGRNSSFFYNLANLRKKIGVKVNLEMFWLVDEMYKQRRGKIHISLGKPVHYTYFDNSKTDAAWADHMKSKVYELGKSNE